MCIYCFIIILSYVTSVIISVLILENLVLFAFSFCTFLHLWVISSANTQSATVLAPLTCRSTCVLPTCLLCPASSLGLFPCHFMSTTVCQLKPNVEETELLIFPNSCLPCQSPLWSQGTTSPPCLSLRPIICVSSLTQTLSQVLSSRIWHNPTDCSFLASLRCCLSCPSPWLRPLSSIFYVSISATHFFIQPWQMQHRPFGARLKWHCKYYFLKPSISHFYAHPSSLPPFSIAPKVTYLSSFSCSVTVWFQLSTAA